MWLAPTRTPGMFFEINSITHSNGGIYMRDELLGKFDWGVWYVIIFLYVQCWIRLTAVSYRNKKVRTLASPVVRSVKKSCDTPNCVRNEPEYAICVLFTTRLYYKALEINLCDLMWQIRRNWWPLWLQVTARCQRWARPVAWGQSIKNSIMMCSCKGPRLFLRSVRLIGNEQGWRASHLLLSVS